MIDDILQWFPFRGHKIQYGLFSTPIAKRELKCGLSRKTYGVDRTYYAEANDILLNDTTTLLDMFHGLCVPFTVYFTNRHPDFTPTVLERPCSFYNTTNHAFALKHLPNGICLFADARGITDDPIEFFSDYTFSKNNMAIKQLKIAPDEYEDGHLFKPDQICKTAYNIIFENCPYLK